MEDIFSDSKNDNKKEQEDDSNMDWKKNGFDKKERVTLKINVEAANAYEGSRPNNLKNNRKVNDKKITPDGLKRMRKKIRDAMDEDEDEDENDFIYIPVLNEEKSDNKLKKALTDEEKKQFMQQQMQTIGNIRQQDDLLREKAIAQANRILQWSGINKLDTKTADKVRLETIGVSSKQLVQKEQQKKLREEVRKGEPQKAKSKKIKENAENLKSKKEAKVVDAQKERRLAKAVQKEEERRRQQEEERQREEQSRLQSEEKKREQQLEDDSAKHEEPVQEYQNVAEPKEEVAVKEERAELQNIPEKQPEKEALKEEKEIAVSGPENTVSETAKNNEEKEKQIRIILEKSGRSHALSEHEIKNDDQSSQEAQKQNEEKVKEQMQYYMQQQRVR